MPKAAGELLRDSSASSRAGSRLLLVEDEALVAMMMEDLLDSLGCDVLASVRSVEEGLQAVDAIGDQLDGAILDVSLGDEAVYPVAEALERRGVPFAFATGYDAGSLDPRYAHRPTLAKPFEMLALAGLLREAFPRAA